MHTSAPRQAGISLVRFAFGSAVLVLALGCSVLKKEEKDSGKSKGGGTGTSTSTDTGDAVGTSTKTSSSTSTATGVGPKTATNNGSVHIAVEKAYLAMLAGETLRARLIPTSCPEGKLKKQLHDDVKDTKKDTKKDDALELAGNDEELKKLLAGILADQDKKPGAKDDDEKDDGKKDDDKKDDEKKPSDDGEDMGKGDKDAVDGGGGKSSSCPGMQKTSAKVAKGANGLELSFDGVAPGEYIVEVSVTFGSNAYKGQDWLVKLDGSLTLSLNSNGLFRDGKLVEPLSEFAGDAESSEDDGSGDDGKTDGSMGGDDKGGDDKADGSDDKRDCKETRARANDGPGGFFALGFACAKDHSVRTVQRFSVDGPTKRAGIELELDISGATMAGDDTAFGLAADGLIVFDPRDGQRLARHYYKHADYRNLTGIAYDSVHDRVNITNVNGVLFHFDVKERKFTRVGSLGDGKLGPTAWDPDTGDLIALVIGAGGKSYDQVARFSAETRTRKLTKLSPAIRDEQAGNGDAQLAIAGDQLVVLISEPTGAWADNDDTAMYGIGAGGAVEQLRASEAQQMNGDAEKIDVKKEDE